MRQAGSKGKPIFTVRLRNLERAGLIGLGRIHGKLAVLLTPAGETLVAERRDRRRARLRGKPNGEDQPVAWWL